MQYISVELGGMDRVSLGVPNVWPRGLVLPTVPQGGSPFPHDLPLPQGKMALPRPLPHTNQKGHFLFQLSTCCVQKVPFDARCQDVIDIIDCRGRGALCLPSPKEPHCRH